MKNSAALAFTALTLCAALAARAQDQPAGTAGSPTDQKEKISYAIGFNVGSNIKRSAYELDTEQIIRGIQDVLADQATITDAEAGELIKTYQQELMRVRNEQMRLAAEANKEKGKAWLAENKTKEGVQTKEVALPDGTKAELQYKVIQVGNGPVPAAADTVRVHYRGTLIDGREFDSSAKHGTQPAKFAANRVIRGWTEALTMMPVGSKWEIYVPSELAYGDRGSGANIEPGSTLIFEIELVGIEPQTRPVTTSDIIKVPSAEELAKGAKIEVIKAEDAERLAKEAEAKARTTGPEHDHSDHAHDGHNH